MLGGAYGQGDPVPSAVENRQAAFSRVNSFLRDRGSQLTQCGYKLGDNIGKHVPDLLTGYWENPGYSRSKPPRWLMSVDVTANPATAEAPAELDEIGIGFSNTSKGATAGLAVRILPMLKTGDDLFTRADEFEVDALFVFHGPVGRGSAADPFSYVPGTGELLRSTEDEGKQPVEYVLAALLAIKPRTDTMAVQVNGAPKNVTYGEVLDALAAAITAQAVGGAAGPIPVYDMTNDAEVLKLANDVEAAWQAAGPPPVQVAAGAEGAVAAPEAGDDEAVEAMDLTAIEIPENPDLLGIDPSVYRQINAALKSGKQHLMLYGPPGTGKTSLARWIAGSLPGGDWTLVTGSSDWSSQDIIGGYQPIGDGDVDFVPGILLRAFDQPLIIDELNRCDIDKVIGPLFTVLSGQQTTLPYRTDLADKDSQPYVILPKPKASKAAHEFAPGTAWRLIATINSIDKASLYQMSYALSRRFGWIYVDAPTDLAGFIAQYVAKTDPAAPEAAGQPCPLADLWKAINAVRVIGPAPIIDAIHAIRVLAPGSSFFGAADQPMREAALDAVDMVMLPMLDGIVLQDAVSIAEAATAAYGFAGAEVDRITRRLEAMAI